MEKSWFDDRQVTKYSLPNCSDRLWDPHIRILNGCRASFSRVKAAEAWIFHLHLVPKLRCVEQHFQSSRLMLWEHRDIFTFMFIWSIGTLEHRFQSNKAWELININENCWHLCEFCKYPSGDDQTNKNVFGFILSVSYKTGPGVA
jgi:hypothetical protein